jgi:hypothetical protein
MRARSASQRTRCDRCGGCLDSSYSWAASGGFAAGAASADVVKLQYHSRVLTNRLFRLGVVAAVAPLTVAALFAQPKPGSAAEPVNVLFRALTSAGSPVTDLTAADIVLKVGGRERAIRGFDRLRLGDAAGNQVADTAAFATNVPAATGPRDTLIVIDDQSIPPGEEKRLVAAVEQYLSALGPSDRVGVAYVQDRGLNVLMSNDRDRLRAGLKATTGRAPAVESSDDAICRTRRVIDALISVSGTVPSASVPVTVLMFTTGVAPPPVALSMAKKGGFQDPPTSACEVTVREYQQLERAVAGSAVNLFVVAASLSTSTAMQQGIENLAGASGNPLMELAKGGDSDMARVARENTAWYRVSFLADAAERTGSVQRIEVQTKRPGVSAKTRSQVLMPKAVSSQPASAKDMLREARTHRDLEFRAQAYTSMEPGSDKVKVMVLLEPVDPSVVLKSATVGLFDRSGKLAVQGTAEAANLARTPGVMAVLANPGKYRLRVAAVDGASRGGTVDIDVDASLITAGALKFGSLILGVADGAFAGRLQFTTEPAAIGYLEVYGLPAGGQLSAQMEFAQSPTGPALATAPTRILGDSADGKRVIIGGVSIAQLPPGDIVCRMVVSLDGKPVGQAVQTLHKASK